MNRLGIIGTAAAWLNYRKAKAEYEALKEKKDGIQSAVALYQSLKYYNEHKFDKPEYTQPEKDELDIPEAEENNIPDGVFFSSILRVSYMVGKFCHVKPSLVVSNTSDKSYYIRWIDIQCAVDGNAVSIFKNALNEQGKYLNPESRALDVDYTLQPGETKEFEFDYGRTMLLNAAGESIMGYVRDLICAAAGKKLITSCPKGTSVDGVVTASTMILWRDSKVEETKKGWLYEIPGVLRYCGELPL